VQANITTAAPADLVASKVSAAAASVAPGGLLSLEVATVNAGSTPSPATVTRLYLSSDQAIGGSDMFLGDVAVPALCAGCTAGTPVTVTVPAGTAPGNYVSGACADAGGQVQESNKGNNCLAGSAVAVEGSIQLSDCRREGFSGRFLADWSASSGEWSLFEESLRGEGRGDEAWMWASGRLQDASGRESYTFDLQPSDSGRDPAVGRHGGVMFCASSPTRRMDPSESGYILDWIDRAADQGLRLLSFDGGQARELQVGTPQFAEPPSNWRIVLDSRRIRVFADGVPCMDVADATYRGGYFGVWAFTGQTVRLDNLSFGTACGTVQRPFDLTLDGALDLSDCVSLLGFLFLGDPARLPCGDGTPDHAANKVLADHNGDGRIDLSDAMAALGHFFLGGPPPASGEVCLPIEGCPRPIGGLGCLERR